MGKIFLMMRETKSRSRGGFTMLELAVAILVFCLGFVGVNKMHAMAVKGNSFNMQLTEATSVMKSKSEELMGLPVDSASLGGALPIPKQVSFTSLPVEYRKTSFTPSWTVSQIPGTNLKEITVTVRWTDTGSNHSVSVTFCR